MAGDTDVVAEPALFVSMNVKVWPLTWAAVGTQVTTPVFGSIDAFAGPETIENVDGVLLPSVICKPIGKPTTENVGLAVFVKTKPGSGTSAVTVIATTSEVVPNELVASNVTLLEPTKLAVGVHVTAPVLESTCIPAGGLTAA